MIKSAVILKLLESLREHITLLRPAQAESLAELMADPLRYNGVIRLLQVAVEHMLNIGAHLLAGSGLEAPDEYKKIILKLGEGRAAHSSLRLCPTHRAHGRFSQRRRPRISDG